MLTRSIQLTIAATLSLAACSGGQVIYGGDPANNATVTYTNCQGNTWTTTTNSNGVWVLNPFDPNSSAFDSSQYIPPGAYLASAKLGVWERADMVSHSYDDTCAIEWNNNTQSRPCTRRDFDLGFKPLSGWEHNAKLEAQKQHNDLQRYSYFIEYCIHFGGGN